MEAAPHSPDVSAGEILARYFSDQLDGKQVYVESFPTAMGTGFGLVSQPGIRPNGEVETFPDLLADGSVRDSFAVRVGMAVALSCPVGGGPGLLVVGTCLDPAQMVSLASLVALVGGTATVEKYGTATEEP